MDDSWMIYGIFCGNSWGFDQNKSIYETHHDLNGPFMIIHGFQSKPSKLKFYHQKLTIDPLNLGLQPAKLVDFITKKEALPAMVSASESLWLDFVVNPP